MEHKTFKFQVEAADDATGEWRGYAATFRQKPDLAGDIIDPGAFAKTIRDNNGEFASFFPPHDIKSPVGMVKVEEDSKGLHVVGRLVRGVQKADEVLLLMRAGVVKTMSIGYDTVKREFVGSVRHLKEIRLMDVSPVPGNLAADNMAVITSVKTATTFDDLPLANRDVAWDATAAERQVRAWAGGESPNFDKYSRAFMWFDSADPELFGSYKLGFAGISGGRLTAIPRGIFAVAGVLMGARGGVNIPDADQAKVRTHCEQYYAKMRSQWNDDTIVAPWNKKSGDAPDEETDEEMNEVKAGRVLSAASMEKIQAALDALRVLLESATVQEEPGKSHSPGQDALDEATEANAMLDSIGAEMESSYLNDAANRIDRLLERISQEVTESV